MMMRRGLRGRALIERRTSWLERKLVADKIESFPELWSHVRQIGHVLVRALMSVSFDVSKHASCLLAASLLRGRCSSGFRNTRLQERKRVPPNGAHGRAGGGSRCGGRECFEGAEDAVSTSKCHFSGETTATYVCVVMKSHGGLNNGSFRRLKPDCSGL